MRLGLALVVGPAAAGCSVVPLGARDAVPATFGAAFARRAASLPEGSLVAVDLDTTPPAVVWRWFPARVLAVADGAVTLDEPVHGVLEARLHPALARPVAIDETVYVAIGLTDEWRIDASADEPGAAAAVLPEIEAFYGRMASEGGREAGPEGP